MNQDVANIALMYVLPLGITFVTILLTASAPERTHKLIGAVLSLICVAMDCLFYFAKNAFVTYNADGGLLLAFASLIIFGILNAVRGDDLPAKVGHLLFSAFMMAAFIGIAYWERPTLLVTADYTPEEIAAQNAKYQDYIQSFQNGEGGKWKTAPKQSASKGAATATADRPSSNMSATAKGRLDKYVDESSKVIDRMNDIIAAIDNFGTIPANISESERESRSQQALAINNNATSLNKKTLGLFHPHESSEAHSELIQASESIRLAAYSLYTYTLQENADEQVEQYKQCRNQIAQAKSYLGRFWQDIENLKSNYQPQQEEN